MSDTPKQSTTTEANPSSVSRRDFLRVGGLSVVGLSVAERAAAFRSQGLERRNCIFILMSGGASQFETFDPKPEASAGIRGPLKAISTAVPGIFLSESLPRLAQRMGNIALLRSLCHSAAPIHETGLQLLQTGRLTQGARQFPHFGSLVNQALGSRSGAPASVVLPRLLRNTGVNNYQGQTAGFLNASFNSKSFLETDSADDPVGWAEDERELAKSIQSESDSIRLHYGDHRFGRLCLQARKLVEAGTRCVTVNLFDSLANQVTWDCHAKGPGAPATLYDYRDTLCPQFDQAVSALLDDLNNRGLLENTLVVAVGEMGRTPQINSNGGRDHWNSCWSAMMAGAGVKGGNVIGGSDAFGMLPVDRPIDPAELTATIYERLGIDGKLSLSIGDDEEFPLSDHEPIAELFA